MSILQLKGPVRNNMYLLDPFFFSKTGWDLLGTKVFWRQGTHPYHLLGELLKIMCVFSISVPLMIANIYAELIIQSIVVLSLSHDRVTI